MKKYETTLWLKFQSLFKSNQQGPEQSRAQLSNYFTSRSISCSLNSCVCDKSQSLTVSFSSSSELKRFTLRHVLVDQTDGRHSSAAPTGIWTDTLYVTLKTCGGELSWSKITRSVSSPGHLLLMYLHRLRSVSQYMLLLFIWA